MALVPMVVEQTGRGERSSVITVFGTFFLAELGDKTQLTALALAADSSSTGIDITKLLLVFAGASIALFAADVLGLLVGYFLGKTLPSSLFAWISFAIFAVFGIVKLISGFEGIFAGAFNARLWTIICTSVLCLIFAAMTMIKFLRGDRKNEKDPERV